MFNRCKKGGNSNKEMIFLTGVQFNGNGCYTAFDGEKVVSSGHFNGTKLLFDWCQISSPGLPTVKILKDGTYSYYAFAIDSVNRPYFLKQETNKEVVANTVIAQFPDSHKWNNNYQIVVVKEK